MSNPLFTAAEEAAHTSKINALRQKYYTNQNDYSRYSAESAAVENAHRIEEVRRAQARAEEFLDALIVLVGSRGANYVDFESAFSQSSDPEYRKAVMAYNTPEARRNLYTILKALTEIPKSWATSAFVRFLRGNGKQKGAKYHGAGYFGVLYGWKEEEVHSIANILTGDRWGTRHSYCQVLMRYADVEQEIREQDPDYEVVDYNAHFYATRAERDIKFINKLCEMLDSQGLGPVVKPAEEKPKKERKVKQFHSGDIIRKSNIRDLPLPAHVQIPIERLDKATDPWVSSTIQRVVTQLASGRYVSAVVHSDGKNAYYESEFDARWGRDKRELEGATFLGEWSGKIPEKKFIRVNFGFRVPWKK